MQERDNDKSKATATQEPAGLLPRRGFLFRLGAVGLGSLALTKQVLAELQQLQPLEVVNPLAAYPSRGWEKVYRDLYKADSTFSFLCAPNDTHNCLLTAYVKNGVVTRIGPTWKFGQATDLDGNKASGRWDPRCCQKGLALVRKFYGDRRIKRPMGRKGFVDWYRANMPRDPVTGAVDPKYLQRGLDPWVPLNWDETFEMTAKVLTNIATTYNGEAGKKRLLAQGCDPLMVEATQGAGVQVLKFRGGMPALGMTRVMAQYRLANSMALVDAKLRKVGPDKALGARGWDNYTWHTDLPPGHPMVTGVQTNDFDLCLAERAGLVVVWGMNWITTKMPDAHWLTEARLKGTKIIVIACEYAATTNKADEALIVRPGTTPALALGVAQVLISEKLYDEAFVKSSTDLPLLVRMDNGLMLRASEVWKDQPLAELKNFITVLKDGEQAPPPVKQAGAYVTETQRKDWGDHVIWDAKNKAPTAVNRDLVGDHWRKAGLDPQLEGEVEVALADGKKVKCRTVFDVTRTMLDQSYSPEQVEKLTWAPAEAIRSIARQIAKNPKMTLFACGMGPNQFFNSDLKDRSIFLVAALTQNVGHPGGNVGSYAGNYRWGYLSGVPQYIMEDPFNIELDPKKPAKVKAYFKGESVHYWNHGDTILRSGKTVLTGKTHMPTPTKSILVSNSNSLIGNVKGHYDVVANVLPKQEFIGVSDWWWTASCEYADIVYAIDSWAEMKYPDLTISVTNPFLYTFPVTPLPRIHDTRSDLEVAAGIGRALGKVVGEPRMAAMWNFVEDGKARPYLQRILDGSADAKGYQIADLETKAEAGTPAILMTRTYPKYSSMEQVQESKPWYTKTGRMEFYREEPEFRDSGESIVVHREPIDSTFYEPNVIVAAAHPLLRPKSPADYGVDPNDLSGDARQARHVIKTVEELLKTEHPLHKEGYRFIFHTPKYRHGAHTTPTDIDIVAVWFGPFGDMHRTDKRKPFVSEAYVDIHPLDAKGLGIEDGDYVWIDADPHDRPFHGWQKRPEFAKVARLQARARYYPGTPRGVTRMWHNMYGSTIGSVMGAETNPTGLAKSPVTGYQSHFRTGSHQSATRGWLKPTWMTDSLYVKNLFGQVMKQGFVPDVHCPVGAPRESMVRITKSEDGGLGGKGLWRAAQLGLRPGYETEDLKTYIRGGFHSKS